MPATRRGEMRAPGAYHGKARSGKDGSPAARLLIGTFCVSSPEEPISCLAKCCTVRRPPAVLRPSGQFAGTSPTPSFRSLLPLVHTTPESHTVQRPSDPTNCPLTLAVQSLVLRISGRVSPLYLRSSGHRRVGDGRETQWACGLAMAHPIQP